MRIIIPTTDGLCEVEQLVKEDPSVRSVVCLNGTPEMLPISAAYDAFVRKPTGLIEQWFGHPAFRLDLDRPITHGQSWQLGFFITHLLLDRGHLSDGGTSEDHARSQAIIWATGELTYSGEVRAVGQIDKKLHHTAELIRQARREHLQLILVLAEENAREARKILAADLQKQDNQLQILSVNRLDQVVEKIDALVEDTPRPKKEINPPSDRADFRGKIGSLKKAGIVVLLLALAGLTLGIGQIFFPLLQRWQIQIHAGELASLSQDLDTVAQGSCTACRWSEKIYRYLLQQMAPSSDLFSLQRVEMLMATNGTCSRTGRVLPLASTPGRDIPFAEGQQFVTGAGGGRESTSHTPMTSQRCGFRYQIHKQGGADLHFVVVDVSMPQSADGVYLLSSHDSQRAGRGVSVTLAHYSEPGSSSDRGTRGRIGGLLIYAHTSLSGLFPWLTEQLPFIRYAGKVSSNARAAANWTPGQNFSDLATQDAAQHKPSRVSATAKEPDSMTGGAGRSLSAKQQARVRALDDFGDPPRSRINKRPRTPDNNLHDADRDSRLKGTARDDVSQDALLDQRSTERAAFPAVPFTDQQFRQLVDLLFQLGIVVERIP